MWLLLAGDITLHLCPKVGYANMLNYYKGICYTRVLLIAVDINKVAADKHNLLILCIEKYLASIGSDRVLIKDLPWLLPL